jgi:hypothetical protein
VIAAKRLLRPHDFTDIAGKKVDMAALGTYVHVEAFPVDEQVAHQVGEMPALIEPLGAEVIQCLVTAQALQGSWLFVFCWSNVSGTLPTGVKLVFDLFTALLARPHWIPPQTPPGLPGFATA